MTGEQKAALDLAILNLRTHGDDQLLSAVQPLIEFYESRVLAERKEPVAWVRYRSDGGFEGPIMDSDARMCDTRRSFWTPLFTHPTPDDASIQERIPKGWCLYACDFSIQGSPGSVTLKRDKEGVSWWFSLPEYRREKTDLFLYGRGKTIEEALDAAIDRARQSGEEGK
jgi:hypothetical protein